MRRSEVGVISGNLRSPQGTVLGPLLFLLYINDMPSVVDSGTCFRLFPVEALVYRVINDIEDQVVLQQDLIRLETWAKSWGMVFNPSKCYMMHIRKVGGGGGGGHPDHMYQLCGTILGSVTSEKYLGLYLNHILCTHIRRVSWIVPQPHLVHAHQRSITTSKGEKTSIRPSHQSRDPQWRRFMRKDYPPKNTAVNSIQA